MNYVNNDNDNDNNDSKPTTAATTTTAISTTASTLLTASTITSTETTTTTRISMNCSSSSASSENNSNIRSICEEEFFRTCQTITTTTIIKTITNITSTELLEDEDNENNKDDTNNTNTTSSTSSSSSTIESKQEEIVQYQNEEEICGPCLENYIEWNEVIVITPTSSTRENENNNTNNTIPTSSPSSLFRCISISEITLDQFLETYQPIYRKSSESSESSSEPTLFQEISNTKRLQLLLESIQYIRKNNQYRLSTNTTRTTMTMTTSIMDDENDNNNSTINNTNINNNNNHNNASSASSSSSSSSSSSLLLLIPPFELGITPYSADDPSEYFQRSGYFPILNSTASIDQFRKVPTPTIAKADLPLTVDWVQQGAMTYVKNQGRCGCCWAASLAAVMESATYIDTNENFLQSLSIQQYISCNLRNLGCDGGNLIVAMGYTFLNTFGGLSTFNDYPFLDEQGITTEACYVTTTTNNNNNNNGNEQNNNQNDKEEDFPIPIIPPPLAVKMETEPQIAFDTIPDTILSTMNDDDILLFVQERIQTIKQILAYQQPIAMVMKSNCRLFSNYKRGILTQDDDCACYDSLCADHAVVMVGYDDTADIPYFKLRNSWGTQWGEDGYFRIAQQMPSSGSGSGSGSSGDNIRPYGLFGILSHGVIPGRTVNVTNQQEEIIYDNQTSLQMEVWMIFVIAVASLVGCVCCMEGCASIRRYRRAQEKEKKKQQQAANHHHHHHHRDRDRDRDRDTNNANASSQYNNNNNNNNNRNNNKNNNKNNNNTTTLPTTQQQSQPNPTTTATNSSSNSRMSNLRSQLY